MANYKNIRLEEHVYQELIRRQRPRESLSQVAWRVLQDFEQVCLFAKRITEIAEGDKQ